MSGETRSVGQREWRCPKWMEQKSTIRRQASPPVIISAVALLAPVWNSCSLTKQQASISHAPHIIRCKSLRDLSPPTFPPSGSHRHNPWLSIHMIHHFNLLSSTWRHVLSNPNGKERLLFSNGFTSVQTGIKMALETVPAVPLRAVFGPLSQSAYFLLLLVVTFSFLRYRDLCLQVF